jgi:DNA-binding MarR family transcriptional regulator
MASAPLASASLASAMSARATKTKGKRRPHGPQSAKGGFAHDDYAFYLIAHVDHRYTLGADRFSRTEWRTLAILSSQDGVSIGELADVTLIKRSTLSRVADRMEEQGLVIRKPRADDARIIEVHITERGRAFFQDILGVANRQYERAVEGLSDADLDRFHKTLRHMLDNLTRSPFA